MQILKETISTPKDLKELQSECREFLSLGSNIGFRQISGIDIMANIDAAIRYLDELNAEKPENADAEGFEAYQSRVRTTIEEYLAAARKEIQYIRKCCDDLTNGSNSAEALVNTLSSLL